jgi:acetoin utilization deacetylase AcuC-like enzyme
MNRTFSAGAGRDEILSVYDKDLAQAMESFRPQLVMISAGFDGRMDDPLGQFNLTDADFKDITACLMGIAARHADHRLVSVLEGGYNLQGLASATAVHVRELIFGQRSA